MFPKEIIIYKKPSCAYSYWSLKIFIKEIYLKGSYKHTDIHWSDGLNGPGQSQKPGHSILVTRVGRQGSKYMDHHPLLFQTHWQGAVSEAVWPKLELALGYRKPASEVVT